MFLLAENLTVTIIIIRACLGTLISSPDTDQLSAFSVCKRDRTEGILGFGSSGSNVGTDVNVDMPSSSAQQQEVVPECSSFVIQRTHTIDLYICYKFQRFQMFFILNLTRISPG